MELGQEKSNYRSNTISVSEEGSSELISNDECNYYLGRYELSDQRVTSIKDNLIGIVDSVFSSYLEEFK